MARLTAGFKLATGARALGGGVATLKEQGLILILIASMFSSISGPHPVTVLPSTDHMTEGWDTNASDVLNRFPMVQQHAQQVANTAGASVAGAYAAADAATVDVLQVLESTHKDKFEPYPEVLSHIPAFAGPAPRRVGGAVAETLGPCV